MQGLVIENFWTNYNSLRVISSYNIIYNHENKENLNKYRG